MIRKKLKLVLLILKRLDFSFNSRNEQLYIEPKFKNLSLRWLENRRWSIVGGKFDKNKVNELSNLDIDLLVCDQQIQ